MNPDMNKVEAFAGQVVTDIAAAFSGVMTNIGHKLGLYKAMAGAEAITASTIPPSSGSAGRRPGPDLSPAFRWSISADHPGSGHRMHSSR